MYGSEPRQHCENTGSNKCRMLGTSTEYFQQYNTGSYLEEELKEKRDERKIEKNEKKEKKKKNERK